MADDIRKGLGIKRRKPNDGSESAPATPRKSSSSSSSSGPRLGIKRRSGPTATRPELEDSSETDASEADASQAEATEAEATTEADGPDHGAGLGNDLTATLLAQHFRFRPELRERLPERLFSMHRTHGRYLGDNRVERTLEVGFRPALVLYVMPPYGIDAPPKLSAKGIVESGLHRQPTMVESGFTVDKDFNKIGDMYMYVAFEDDGEPLELETKKGRASSRGGRSSSGSSGPPLGIKRRN